MTFAKVLNRLVFTALALTLGFTIIMAIQRLRQRDKVVVIGRDVPNQVEMPTIILCPHQSGQFQTFNGSFYRHTTPSLLQLIQNNV